MAKGCSRVLIQDLQQWEQTVVVERFTRGGEHLNRARIPKETSSHFPHVLSQNRHHQPVSSGRKPVQNHEGAPQQHAQVALHLITLTVEFVGREWDKVGDPSQYYKNCPSSSW